jgi:uncharacterized membrane protein
MIATMNNFSNYPFSFSALSALSAVKKIVQKSNIIVISILLDLCRRFFLLTAEGAENAENEKERCLE